MRASITSLIILISLITGCTEPLAKKYNQEAHKNNIEEIRQQSAEIADQIKEQLEFDNYEGKTYERILDDFRTRAKRIEEDLAFIDQMKALKDSMIIEVSWLKATDLNFRREDEQFIGDFTLISSFNQSIEKIEADISFKNYEHNDENNCHYLVFELNTDFNTHEIDQKNIKFFGLSGYPASCPLSVYDYGESKIYVHKVEFSNGSTYSSDDFKTRIAYRYRSIRKSLTPVLLTFIWTKNKAWGLDENLVYEEKLMRAKDDIEYREKYEYSIP